MTSDEVFKLLWDWYTIGFAIILMTITLANLAKWGYNRFKHGDEE